MSDKTLKIVKVAASVASVGIALVTSFIATKELDKKVSDKVTEALSKASGEES